MEFNELKQVWDAQNKTPLYVFDKEALQNSISRKKDKTNHITDISEWLLIIVNLAGGSFIFGTQFMKQHPNPFMCMMAFWMFASSIYVMAGRYRNKKSIRRFDRSMRGDLDQAIFMAIHQVRLSLIMRWNILPVAAFTILGIWETKKLPWMVGLISAIFFIAFFASSWEHGIYVRRRKDLEHIKSELEAESTEAQPDIVSTNN